MSGFLFHVGASAICSHAGTVSTISSNARVLVSGQPVATSGDTYIVAGCPFMAGSVPQPCIKVQWLVPSTRVFVNKQPAILQSSVGICQSAAQIPQGTPNVVATQVRVRGT